MSQRFFRGDAATYEAIRADLNAAWGLPNDKGTLTCIAPAATAPTDSQGRVLLAVHDEFATWEPAATLLPNCSRAVRWKRSARRTTGPLCRRCRDARRTIYGQNRRRLAGPGR